MRSERNKEKDRKEGGKREREEGEGFSLKRGFYTRMQAAPRSWISRGESEY